MRANKVGLAFVPLYIDASTVLRQAAEIDSSPYVDSIWLSEELGGFDLFAVLGGLAVKTSRVRLATGVVSFFKHNPVSLAESALSLAELSNSRFALGIGTGVVEWLTKGLGIVPDRPLTRMRETVTVIRSLADTGKVSFDGQCIKAHATLKGLRQAVHLPVYVAAVQRQMMRAAYSCANGIILPSASTAAYVRSVSKMAEEYPQKETIVLTHVAISSDSETAVKSMEPVVRKMLARPERLRTMFQGSLSEDEMVQLEASVNRGGSLPAELVKQASASGTLEDCISHVEGLFSAGASTVVLVPIKPEIGRIMELAKQVIKSESD